jgi:ABC-type multidrug transport system fused ATPase/permease subunit
MERLMQGRTTLMIAHRLSTLEICDQLLRIENGRIVSITENKTEKRLAAHISGGGV